MKMKENETIKPENEIIMPENEIIMPENEIILIAKCIEGISSSSLPSLSCHRTRGSVVDSPFATQQQRGTRQEVA